MVMILFNILITDDQAARQVLSDQVKENIDSFKRAHPALPHRLFGGEEIREFIWDYPSKTLRPG